MNYFELRQKKLPIGSGAVEAACKNLIGARMKKSGMRWSIDGGQTVCTRLLLFIKCCCNFHNFFVGHRLKFLFDLSGKIFLLGLV